MISIKDSNDQKSYNFDIELKTSKVEVIYIAIKCIEIIILLILALKSDIKTYKIKNNIVLPFIVIGFLTNMYLDGIAGILFSFKGMAFPIITLIIFFVLRMLGAGDIKLFSAIGAIMGLEFVLYTIVYSFLAGGVISLVLIIIRKNVFERFKHFFQYLKSCILTQSILQYTDFDDKSDGGKFRFAFAMVCGVFINIVILNF